MPGGRAARAAAARERRGCAQREAQRTRARTCPRRRLSFGFRSRGANPSRTNKQTTEEWTKGGTAGQQRRCAAQARTRWRNNRGRTCCCKQAEPCAYQLSSRTALAAISPCSAHGSLGSHVPRTADRARAESCMRVRAVGEAGQGDRTGLFVAAGGEVALAKRSSALATAPSAHSVSRAHGPDSSACRARSSSAALPPSPPPLASSITPPDTAIGGPPRAAIFL
jgi:hypothetical protein